MVENLASSNKFPNSVSSTYIWHNPASRRHPLSNEDFSQFPVQGGEGGGEHVSEILKSPLHNQPTNRTNRRGSISGKW